MIACEFFTAGHLDILEMREPNLIVEQNNVSSWDITMKNLAIDVGIQLTRK